jgi:hypothetical protein
MVNNSAADDGRDAAKYQDSQFSTDVHTDAFPNV